MTSNTSKITSSTSKVSSTKVFLSVLPPCRVCGEKASGFHYGTNTCEACKGFFRRSLQRKEDYKCMGNSDCEIGPGRRNGCSHCRYRKCIAVGMSKVAIKTGRYTHEKKAKDTEEVLQLQLKEQTKKAAATTVVRFSESREKELEAIIRRITDTHSLHTPHTPEFFKNLPDMEKAFLEQRALQQQVFGEMKPIPNEVYMHFFKTTGIDIDGRREIIKHMLPCLEKAIKRFISFAKALPGFKELPIDDQIALIKAAHFDVWFISSSRAFNVELKLFTTKWYRTVQMDDYSTIFNEEYAELCQRVAATIQRLRLSEEEICVLSAISLLSTDCCVLAKPEKVEQVQLILLEALECLVLKCHPNECSRRLGKCLNVLVEIRTLREFHAKNEEKIILEWSDNLLFPQTYLDLVT